MAICNDCVGVNEHGSGPYVELCDSHAAPWAVHAADMQELLQGVVTELPDFKKLYPDAASRIETLLVIVEGELGIEYKIQRSA